MRRFSIVLFACLAVLPVRAAELRITGMRSMSESEAVDLVTRRLEFIEKRPASTSLADDAAYLLNRLLVLQGFTEPEVDWKLPGGNRIVLTVKEGPRSTLGDISVEGLNEELTEALRLQIRSAHKDRSSILGDTTPFLTENNEQAMIDALHFLQAEGYWEAKVRLARTRRNPKTTAVDLFVVAETGPLYHLLPATYDMSPGPEPGLLERLAKYDDRVATSVNIRKAKARIEGYYRQRGHQFATVKMKLTHRNGKTAMHFTVERGPRYRVGEVNVAGTEKVKPRLIEDRFRKFPGEHYDSDAFNEEIRTLLGTGAFSGIRLENTPRPDGFIDLTLHVTEAKPEGYYFYGGAGSFEGAIVGAGYYHRNLFGNLWNFSSRAEWSGLGLLGDVSLTEPRFLGTDLRFTANAYLTTRSYDGYRKTEAGLGAELEWDLTDRYTMKAYFRNSAATVNSEGLPRRELGPGDYLVHIIGLSQIYDHRDNPTVPKEGYYLRLDTDFGAAFGEGSISFVRAEGRFGFYEPITQSGAIALGGRAGVIVPNGTSTSLPVDLRYFLGGSDSVRSFPQRDLGPKAVTGDPRGGESYWVANAEYIHQLAGLLHGVLFFDAGSLSRDSGDLFAGDVKYALGLGLRLDLPIGPVRLEYGHALNPGDGDPSGAFHFAIGATF